jgi:hypothetical protein
VDSFYLRGPKFAVAGGERQDISAVSGLLFARLFLCWLARDRAKLRVLPEKVKKT